MIEYKVVFELLRISGQWLNGFMIIDMLPNSKKCHYGSLGKSSNDDKFVFGNLCLENSNKKVILGYNNRQLANIW